MKLRAMKTQGIFAFAVCACVFYNTFCSLQGIWASPQTRKSTSFRDWFLDSTGDYGEDSIYTQMPSLFGDTASDEDSIMYDKYAACLAATEGLRRIRDREMTKVREQYKNKKGLLARKKAEGRVAVEFDKNSKNVLNAFGMSLKEFNNIGDEISEDEDLKEKVIEQAYLYRMAATVSMENPTNSDIESKAPPSSSWTGNNNQDKNTKFREFSKSMVEIEKLRHTQIQRLQRSLKITTVPKNLDITDPSVIPFLSPKVRAVVQAFPYQAEEIIKKHGLSSDEFNQMLKAVHSNPFFRWRVQKQAELDNSQQIRP